MKCENCRKEKVCMERRGICTSFLKKAKRRAFRACEWLWESISFSMLAVGFLLIVGCEESVKLDTIALMQVVKYIISGLLLMFVGVMMQHERC